MRATTKLRSLLTTGRTVVAPGAFDGLSARLVAQAGFAAVYASGGAAIAAMQRTLAAIARDGSSAAMGTELASFSERETIVDTPAYLERGRRYQ